MDISHTDVIGDSEVIVVWAEDDDRQCEHIWRADNPRLTVNVYGLDGGLEETQMNVNSDDIHQVVSDELREAGADL